jgi:hypothetical protein
MPIVRFTKEDLLSRKRLSAGWRVLTVKSIEEEAGKSDPTSTNYVCTVVVTGGPDDGVLIKNWFTPKRPDLLSIFIEAFTGDQSIEPGKNYELSNCIGKKVGGYCAYDAGRGWNTVSDWRPASEGASK